MAAVLDARGQGGNASIPGSDSLLPEGDSGRHRLPAGGSDFRHFPDAHALRRILDRTQQRVRNLLDADVNGG